MFIVFYGTNNLGKSTQATLLTERMNTEGFRAQYIKYPIYDLAPTGPMINDYLRAGNPEALSPRELQLLHALNRTHAEPAIKKKLRAGIHLVVEDYIETSIAWGGSQGVSIGLLEQLNSHLKQPDLIFLFEGDRFVASTEAGHAHETKNDLLRAVADILAARAAPSWIRIQANAPIEDIHETIWQAVSERV